MNKRNLLTAAVILLFVFLNIVPTFSILFIGFYGGQVKGNEKTLFLVSAALIAGAALIR